MKQSSKTMNKEEREARRKELMQQGDEALANHKDPPPEPAEREVYVVFGQPLPPNEPVTKQDEPLADPTEKGSSGFPNLSTAQSRSGDVPLVFRQMLRSLEIERQKREQQQMPLKDQTQLKNKTTYSLRPLKRLILRLYRLAETLMKRASKTGSREPRKQELPDWQVRLNQAADEARARIAKRRGGPCG